MHHNCHQKQGWRGMGHVQAASLWESKCETACPVQHSETPWWKAMYPLVTHRFLKTCAFILVCKPNSRPPTGMVNLSSLSVYKTQSPCCFGDSQHMGHPLSYVCNCMHPPPPSSSLDELSIVYQNDRTVKHIRSRGGCCWNSGQKILVTNWLLVYILILSFTHTCTHTCMHTRMHAHTHAYTHTCIHAHMHTRACVCTHTHTHTKRNWTLTSAFQNTLVWFLGAGRRGLLTIVLVTLVSNTRLKGSAGSLKLPVFVYTTDTTMKGLHVSLQSSVLVYTQRILITSLLCVSVSLCYISVWLCFTACIPSAAKSTELSILNQTVGLMLFILKLFFTDLE